MGSLAYWNVIKPHRTGMLKVIDDIKTHWVRTRSTRPDVFCKVGVLRNFSKFTGKHLCQGFFFNKVAGLRPKACNFIKRETLAQVLFCELWEICKNIFFYRTPPVAVSVRTRYFNFTKQIKDFFFFCNVSSNYSNEKKFVSEQQIIKTFENRQWLMNWNVFVKRETRYKEKHQSEISK